MAGETIITVIGNLTDDPELRFTPSGAAVAKFRVASTPRFMDRRPNEWKDGEPLFLACTVWRQAAENVAESLQRGARVIVSGRLKQRTYETREGEKRTVIELEVDEIGPSLRYATAKIRRSARGFGGGGFGAARRRRHPVAAVVAAEALGGGCWSSGGARSPTTRGLRGAGGSGSLFFDPSTTGHPRSNDTYWTGAPMAKPALRKPKKKVNPSARTVTYIDYKDTALLRKFISDRGKIRARRVTGDCPAAARSPGDQECP